MLQRRESTIRAVAELEAELSLLNAETSSANRRPGARANDESTNLRTVELYNPDGVSWGFSLQQDTTLDCIVVPSLEPGGLAQTSGLCVGDIIVSANGVSAARAEDLDTVVTALQENNLVTLVVTSAAEDEQQMLARAVAFDEDSDDEGAEEETGQPRNKQDMHRVNVINEIVQTEKDYVKDLKTVIDGYVLPMKAHKELFTDDQIQIIFSNIQRIYELQVKFLADLEACTSPAPSVSNKIGQCFLRHLQNFKQYSIYCNNHPRACEEMETIQGDDMQMTSFFEGCRLLVCQNISLEGYLLKPIQRICKYPLLLKELQKVTREDHPDFPSVDLALDSMREVAATINEEKRQSEQLSQLQSSWDGWEGPDLNATSSQLMFEGSLMKISGGKCQERHFFLFDNLLVYCKHNLTGGLTVKGKLPTDSFNVIDVIDGVQRIGDTPITNAFKISNDAKNKWYILFAKTPAEKKAWVNAFAAERQKVAEDRKLGIDRRQMGTVGAKRGTPSDARKRTTSFLSFRSRAKSVGNKAGAARKPSLSVKDTPAAAIAAAKDRRKSESLSVLNVTVSLSRDTMSYASKSLKVPPKMMPGEFISQALSLFNLDNPAKDFKVVQYVEDRHVLLGDVNALHTSLDTTAGDIRLYLHHASLPAGHLRSSISSGSAV
eukprot:m.75740 g.75740  ORF g.75740 m.75740 type:complete len:661 (-) comp14605_c0_seq1:25-2007(-)